MELAVEYMKQDFAKLSRSKNYSEVNEKILSKFTQLVGFSSIPINAPLYRFSDTRKMLTIKKPLNSKKNRET